MGLLGVSHIYKSSLVRAHRVLTKAEVPGVSNGGGGAHSSTAFKFKP